MGGADGWISHPGIDRDYNPELTIPGARAAMKSIKARGAAATSVRGRVSGLSYGPGSDEHCDLYLPGTTGVPAPVHLFIHGGYWCTYDATDHAFVGAALRDEGLLCAVVNYTLCPHTTIAAIVGQCRRALQWLAANAAGHGGDPAHITVSGHSAGGHLAAMLAAVSGDGAKAPEIEAIVPVSGVFDIAPMGRSWLQPLLSIDEDMAQACSPVLLDPAGVPTLAIVGARETPAFLRQTREYARMLAAHGVPVETLELPEADHLSIIDDFGTGGRITRIIAELAFGRRKIGSAAPVLEQG